MEQSSMSFGDRLWAVIITLCIASLLIAGLPLLLGAAILVVFGEEGLLVFFVFLAVILVSALLFGAWMMGARETRKTVAIVAQSISQHDYVDAYGDTMKATRVLPSQSPSLLPGPSSSTFIEKAQQLFLEQPKVRQSELPVSISFGGGDE